VGRSLRWQKSLERAREALADYRFREARQGLTDYLLHRPNDGAAHFLLAQACRRARKQDLKAARLHLAEARRLGYPAALVDREAALLRFQAEGNPQDGEKTLLQLVDTQPADEELIREALVRGYFNAGRAPDALTQLCQWLARFPDNWYAHLWRGALYQAMPRPGLAVTDYQQVLQVHPGDAWVERNLGLMLVEGTGNFELARTYLQKALERDPTDDDARVGLASCWRALQKPAAAQALLEQVLARHPDHVEALLTLALVDLDLDQPKRALAVLQRAEPLVGHTDFQETLARLKQLEVPANNLEEVKHVLAVTHLLSTTLRHLGRDQEADAYQRRYEQVRADFLELSRALAQVNTGQREPALVRKIALLYPRVGMADYAESWLQMVLQKNPRDREANQALADYYRHRKDAESQRLARHYQAMADGKN
ncbi:MAG TPA: tetratricopeptide repeat protein, partial [Gemmataceae bacterium]|nr:tetratricopeptide repeat protein [Gemmataceae bacterium]